MEIKTIETTVLKAVEENHLKPVEGKLCVRISEGLPQMKLVGMNIDVNYDK